ncbi:helix-turn-helix domain-containing protein [Streptomyces luteogriseus]|uniref:helix-turn-helix domain-containing protein n=1 Tax=Streptomyces luteogriseus TaxID=68233 RepID=UPI0037FEFD5E
MTTEARVHDQVVLPPAAEDRETMELWSDLGDALEATAASTGGGVPLLITPSGEEIKLPDEAFSILKLVADTINQGLSVTVNPHETWLSTQEAANILGVSRMTVVRWLEEGRLSYERPGQHRKLRLRDVLEFKAGRTAELNAFLGDVAAEEAEQGLY